MTYQVFRVHRGNVLHIIHETRTGKNRNHEVHLLCRNEPADGERDRGTPSCQECLELDNPCELGRGELNFFSRVVGKDPALDDYVGESNARTKLMKRDLIDRENRLTRRGKILALDWTEGPAPAQAVSGIVHARLPLQNAARCGNSGVLDGFVHMTVDKYERIRKLNLHITCVPCALLTRR
jgi:hypothetical protein